MNKFDSPEDIRGLTSNCSRTGKTGMLKPERIGHRIAFMKIYSMLRTKEKNKKQIKLKSDNTVHYFELIRSSNY